MAVCAGCRGDKGELGVCVLRPSYPFHETGRIIGGITFGKIVQPHSEVTVEIRRKLIGAPSYLREIKMQHLELALPWGRMVCHPKSFKQFLEVPFFVDVIIVAEHGQKKAFPETARPDKEQETCRILHALDVSAFVHIIIILFPDSPEV